MSIVKNFFIRKAYKKEFKKSLQSQKIHITNAALNKCVDIAMAMNTLYSETTKGRSINTDEESINYINSFININVANLLKSINGAEESDHSYIG